MGKAVFFELINNDRVRSQWIQRQTTGWMMVATC